MRNPPASRAASSARPSPASAPDQAVLAFDRRQKGMFHSKSFEDYARTRVIPARIKRARKSHGAPRRSCSIASSASSACRANC